MLGSVDGAMVPSTPERVTSNDPGVNVIVNALRTLAAVASLTLNVTSMSPAAMSWTATEIAF